MSDAFELEICQGKYRYRYEAGKQEVWRNGDIWPTMNGKLIGDKFVFSLAVELDEALKERDTLRAKIEQMERQEPAYWGPKHAIEGGSTTVIVGKFPVNPTDTPLYITPAQKENDHVATD